MKCIKFSGTLRCKHITQLRPEELRTYVSEFLGIINLYMACGTRTVYPSKRNKGLSSTFQPPEEGRSVQRPKYCDKQGDKDEDNSPKYVNNVHNASSQKYRQIL